MGTHVHAPAGEDVLQQADTLAQVLQQVDVDERLGSCALVSHTWRTAADAATTDIIVELGGDAEYGSNPNARALEAWLASKGSNVTELSIEHVGGGRGSCCLALPFAQLQQLQGLSLQHLHLLEPTCNADAHSAAAVVPARSSTRSAGSRQQQHQQQPSCLAPLTSLTSLVLSKCVISSISRFSAALQGLTSLQALQLSVSEERDAEQPEAGTLQRGSRGSSAQPGQPAALGDALRQLVQLTSLSLVPCWQGWDRSTLAAIGCMQRLQELDLNGRKLDEDSLAALPLSLTALSITDGPEREGQLEISASTTPRISQLAVLQTLELHGVCIFDPQVLGSLHQLRRLVLHYCELAEPREQPDAAAQRHWWRWDQSTCALYDDYGEHCFDLVWRAEGAEPSVWPSLGRSLFDLFAKCLAAERGYEGNASAFHHAYCDADEYPPHLSRWLEEWALGVPSQLAAQLKTAEGAEDEVVKLRQQVATLQQQLAAVEVRAKAAEARALLLAEAAEAQLGL